MHRICLPAIIALSYIISLPSGAQLQVRGLGNSFAKLAKTKSLAIGYFGGSITEGAGASNPDKTSWRGLTTDWFRRQYPDATITEINAAIGGTGSDLGAFRCQNDLLSKKPDLVFVEFAVNDGGGGEDRIIRAMEGIVRQIWRANPSADIVFIYTITQSLAHAYDDNTTPTAILFDQRVADHYGIPAINVGKLFWQAIHDKLETWQTLTVDTVHPNDHGYSIYANAIAAFLSQHQADRPSPPRRKLPKPIEVDSFEQGRMVDATTVNASGWTVVNKSLAGRYPHYIEAEAKDTELTFEFSGTVIGLYWMMGPDSGDIEWSIDGNIGRRATSWDTFAKQYSRANYAILSDNLSPGKHKLKIKVLGEKQPESTGTWIRIGAFMTQ